MYVRGNSIVTANGHHWEIYFFYLDEVCASFILVLWYKLYGWKSLEKPRLTSKQNEAQIYAKSITIDFSIYLGRVWEALASPVTWIFTITWIPCVLWLHRVWKLLFKGLATTRWPRWPRLRDGALSSLLITYGWFSILPCNGLHSRIQDMQCSMFPSIVLDINISTSSGSQSI